MNDIWSYRKGGLEPGEKKGDDYKYLTAAQLARLLAVTGNDSSAHALTAYDLFAISGNFGLRCLECKTLEFDDFKYLEDDNYFIVRTAKKRAPVRDMLYVGKAEKKLLAGIVQRRRELERGKILFTLPDRAVRKYFAWFAAKANIHPNVSFHSLRHTAARLFLSAADNDMRFPIARLRHKVGGKGQSSTFIYTKPSPEEMIAVANKKGAIE